MQCVIIHCNLLILWTAPITATYCNNYMIDGSGGGCKKFITHINGGIRLAHIMLTEN